MATDITDRLAGLLSGPLAGLGLDLEFVELTKAGKHSSLRVAVDQDGGVDLDQVAEATREVSRVLDETPEGERALAGVLSGPYTLEVSSPGVSRPLTLPRHWRRNTGRLVTCALVEGEPVTGRIRSADDEGAVLVVDGDEVRLGYEQVRKAKVEIEFKRVEGED